MLASIQKEINGVINVCTGKPITLAEKVESYIAENHMNIKLKYGEFADRPYDSPEIWGDTEKIHLIMERADEAKK